MQVAMWLFEQIPMQLEVPSFAKTALVIGNLKKGYMYGGAMLLIWAEFVAGNLLSPDTFPHGLNKSKKFKIYIQVVIQTIGQISFSCKFDNWGK